MMTASRLRLAAVIALLASSLLHVAAMAISPELGQQVDIEGSDVEQTAALGNNFADLVKAGDRLSPVETENSAAVETAAETSPLEPVTAPEAAAKPIQPSAVAAPSPQAFRIEPSGTESLIPSAPAETLAPAEPQLATIQPQAEQREQPEPKPSEARSEPVKPVETVMPVPKPRPVIEPQRKKTQPEKSSSAGSDTSKSRINNKAGTQDGKVTARAASSGKSRSNPKSTDSGNAAASNYPGKVYAKIARTRQRNSGGRGVAHVGFSISSSGQAIGISVSRSSGNARVDSAALAHVKRAAPFPKPPPGARTRFVIPIEFRR